MATAIISVAHKNGIDEFATGLAEQGWDLYATSGTADAITGAEVAGDFSDLLLQDPAYADIVPATNREQRAVLLASVLLAPRKTESAEGSRAVDNIELVCVNFSSGSSSMEPRALPHVDVGGQVLIQAAVRSRRIVIINPHQYESVLKWLGSGKPDEETYLNKLATRAETQSSWYTQDLADTYAI